MQAEPDAVLDRLGLKDPTALFECTPEGVDGTQLRRALQIACERLPQTPQMTLAGWRLQVLAEAGRVLLAEPGQLAAAIHLTRMADPELADTAALAHVRLMALGRIRRIPELLREVDRISIRASIDPKISDVLRSITSMFSLGLALPATQNLYRALWGEFPENLIQRLIALRNGEEPVVPFLERGLKFIHDRTRVVGCSYEEFKVRYAWGLDAAIYLRFLNAITAQELQADSQTAVRLQRLRKQMLDELVISPYVSWKKDQSTVILSAHIGVPALLGFSFFPETDLPKSVIANQVAPDSGMYFNVSAVAPDASFKFLKLLKMCRKQPRLIQLFPDGAFGDTLCIDVLGVPLEIGRGATMLCYHGKALPYFFFTRWIGNKVSIETRQGPMPKFGELQEDFEYRLTSFYGDCIEDILLGPPEDIGVFLGRFTNLLVSKGKA